MYCGHEYAVQALRFAQHVEPSNTAVTNKLEWCKASLIPNKVNGLDLGVSLDVWSQLIVQGYGVGLKRTTLTSPDSEDDYR